MGNFAVNGCLKLLIASKMLIYYVTVNIDEEVENLWKLDEGISYS